MTTLCHHRKRIRVTADAVEVEAHAGVRLVSARVGPRQIRFEVHHDREDGSQHELVVQYFEAKPGTRVTVVHAELVDGELVERIASFRTPA